MGFGEGNKHLKGHEGGSNIICMDLYVSSIYNLHIFVLEKFILKQAESCIPYFLNQTIFGKMSFIIQNRMCNKNKDQ